MVIEMMTYRTGIADRPSDASFMISHLKEPTVSISEACQAEYYTGVDTVQGVTTSETVARLGSTVHPRAQKGLGLRPGHPVTDLELANVMSGRRADGNRVPGKQLQKTTASIASALELSSNSLPDALTLKRISGILRKKIPRTQKALLRQQAAAKRLFALYGLPPNQKAGSDLLRRFGDGFDYNSLSINQDRFLKSLGHKRESVGYIDLTFSADKSLSVAWAFARTPAERACLLQAHQDAVSRVMRDVEVTIGRARRGKAGRDGYDSGAIAWFGFLHYTARPTVYVPENGQDNNIQTQLVTVRTPGDPQLHTHCVIPNLVFTKSGHVGGLDLARLQGRVKEIGALYQAYVADNLRQNGAEVALNQKTGAAQLVQVPEEIRTAFSKRTRQGEDAAQDYARQQNVDWSRLDADQKIRFLKHGTQGDPRQPKTDDLADQNAWQQTITQLGWTVPHFLTGHDTRTLHGPAFRLDAAHRLTCAFLEDPFQKSAVLDGSIVRLCAARALIDVGIDTSADIDTVVSMVRENPITIDGIRTEVLSIVNEDRRGDPHLRITTRLHADHEEEVIDHARTAANNHSCALSEAEIDLAIAASDLDFTGRHGKDQRQAMSTLGTQGRLAVLIGVAGSGKTTLLTPLVHAWTQSGHTVWGTAVAWRQADDLVGAGITQSRLVATHPLLCGIKNGNIRLDSRSVLIVDELSLLSTVQLLALLRAQATTGCRLVMIGDARQCQSVDAGPTVGLLQRALGQEKIPELLSSVRQQTETERATALLFRHGKALEALHRKFEDGSLLFADGDDHQVAEHIADLWLQRHVAIKKKTQNTLTVSAPTNADARMIASVIRDRRRSIGELDRDLVILKALDQHGTPYDLPLARGDRVRLFKRTNAKRDDGRRGIIGNNGSVLEVLDYRHGGLYLRNSHGTCGWVDLETLASPQDDRVLLGYGDVLTIDASQGLTSTEHILAMPRGSGHLDAHRAYVGASRHRFRNWIVTSERAERQNIMSRRGMGSRQSIGRDDIMTAMADNLDRRDQRLSALSLLEDARTLRADALKNFHKTLLQTERRNTPPSLELRLKQARQKQILQGSSSLKTIVELLRSPLHEIGFRSQDMTGNLKTSLRTQTYIAIAKNSAWFEKLHRRRRRRQAVAEALQRTGLSDNPQWHSIACDISPEDLNLTADAEYRALLSRGKKDADGLWIDADALRSIQNRLLRQGRDARRLKPCGLKYATAQVERLFDLTARHLEDPGADNPASSLALLLSSPARQPFSAAATLVADLQEMGMTVSRDPTSVANRIYLDQCHVAQALSRYDVRTVTAVCDRLLLVHDVTARRSRSTPSPAPKRENQKSGPAMRRSRREQKDKERD